MNPGCQPVRVSRPWYRSLIFWLGVPGAPFIVWAWFRSMEGGTGFQWVGKGRSFFLSHGGSTLRFGTDDASLKPERGFDLWDWSLEEIEDLRWFPGPDFVRSAEDPTLILLLPHWLGLLLYLAAWFGLMAAWRARVRRSRRELL